MSALVLSDFVPDRPRDEAAMAAIGLLSSGGDERIVLDPASGLNRYHSGPYPRSITAYASSTANDMSVAAFSHVRELASAPSGTYGERLERLRGRIRSAYDLAGDCAVVFAPSGTDLEYVALTAVADPASGGIHNILLGADEVGSGCRLSAHGMYFAAGTARGVATIPGTPVAGLENVSMFDVPVRCPNGFARGTDVTAEIVAEIEAAHAHGRHPLVHVVHGSKTGLILPKLHELDALRTRYGDGITLVVDACQARITTQALHDYLDRGAIVFLTGSKFMGGPPFSGFALVPPQVAACAGRLPAGLADVFRRAEWPETWPGRDALADEDNQGLWLRLEASIFELERFQRLSAAEIERVLDAFEGALAAKLIDPLCLGRVDPHPPGCEKEAGTHPIEMRTLVTIDVGGIPGARTFDEAQAMHRALALSGLRLGQPVRSVRTPEGDWAGTLRIGLSMPQMVEWSKLDDVALRAMFDLAMSQIGEAILRERRVEAA